MPNKSGSSVVISFISLAHFTRCSLETMARDHLVAGGRRQARCPRAAAVESRSSSRTATARSVGGMRTVEECGWAWRVGIVVDGKAKTGKRETSGSGYRRARRGQPADCNAPCQFPKLSKATWIYGSFRSNEIPRVRGFPSGGCGCLQRKLRFGMYYRIASPFNST